MIYTGAGLMGLLVLFWVVVLTIEAWPVVVIVGGVIGFSFLMGWASKNTDIKGLRVDD